MKPLQARVHEIVAEFPQAEALERERLAEELEGFWVKVRPGRPTKQGVDCSGVKLEIERALNYPPIAFEDLRRRVGGEEYRQVGLEPALLNTLAYYEQSDDTLTEKEREAETMMRAKTLEGYHTQALILDGKQYGTLRNGLKNRKFSCEDLFTTPEEFDRLGDLFGAWCGKTCYFDTMERVRVAQCYLGEAVGYDGYEDIIHNFSAQLVAMRRFSKIPEIVEARKLLQGGLESANRSQAVKLIDNLRDTTGPHFREDLDHLLYVVQGSGQSLEYYGVKATEVNGWLQLPKYQPENTGTLARLSSFCRALFIQDKVSGKRRS